MLFLLSATLTYAGQATPKLRSPLAPMDLGTGMDNRVAVKEQILPFNLCTVTPVLRLASVLILLDATTIPPNSSVSVWVNEGLLKHCLTCSTSQVRMAPSYSALRLSTP